MLFRTRNKFSNFHLELFFRALRGVGRLGGVVRHDEGGRHVVGRLVGGYHVVGLQGVVRHEVGHGGVVRQFRPKQISTTPFCLTTARLKI